jgi:tetratricopeptide (TPR) repeat protein
MKAAKHRHILPALFFAGSVLVFASLVFFLVSDFQSRSERRSFRNAREAADRALQARSWDEASTRIRRAAEYAQTQRQWLQLLKRARRVSRTGVSRTRDDADTALFRSLSRRAAESLPGNEHLQALHIYAELRGGDTERAAKLATEHLRSPEYQSLRAEALLRSGATLETNTADIVPESGTQDSDILLAELSRTSDAPEFLQAYRLTNDSRFVVNAALRHAEQGRLSRAYALLREHMVEHRRAVRVKLAYDLGELEKARAELRSLSGRIASSPEMQMLHADIHLRQGRGEQARLLYQDVIAANPSYSPLAFLNLAAQLRDEAANGNAESSSRALEVIGRGLETFPGNVELIQAGTLLRYESGGASASPSETAVAGGGEGQGRDSTEGIGAKARRRARSFFEEHRRPAASEDEAYLALLELALFSRKPTLESRLAAGWQLRNRFPQDEDIRHYLAWLAYQTGNYQELRHLLQSSRGRETGSGTSSDTMLTFYRGVIAVRDSELSEALEHFAAASEGRPHLWQADFNAGLVHEALGHHRQALSTLERAGSTLSSGDLSSGDLSSASGESRSLTARGGPSSERRPSRKELRGLTLYHRARIHARIGEEDSAKRLVREAVELDPGLHEARRLLQRLAGGIDR